MAKKHTNSPNAFILKLQKMVNGLLVISPSLVSTLTIYGVALPRADLIARLKAWLTLYTNVVQAEQAYTSALSLRTASEAVIHTFYEGLVQALKLELGTTNTAQLEGLGIELPKARTAPSPATKTIAAAKAAATRKARGTMGKKQRLAITATPQPSLVVLGTDGQPFEASAGPVAAAPQDSTSAHVLVGPANSKP